MPFKLGPRRPKVTVPIADGSLEVFELLGSDLHHLAGMREGGASSADVGREVMVRSLRSGDAPVTETLIDALSAPDLAAAVTSVASARALGLPADGTPLERLGQAIAVDLARMAPQREAVAAAVKALKGSTTLSEETLRKITEHTSAIEAASQAISKSGLLEDLAAYTKRVLPQHERIVPHIEPRANLHVLAHNPVADGIAEANRLSKRNTEATIKSTELLGAVATQTAVLAHELSALSKVFLQEAIPQWIQKADDDRKSARYAMWIAAIGLVLGPALAGWQMYQSGEDRRADIARQTVAEQLLRDQLEVARRSEERAVREAEALRRVLEARSASPPVGGSASPVTGAASAIVRSAP